VEPTVHPFLLLIAASSLVCAICAGAMQAQMRDRRAGRASVLALVGFAWWGMCQIFFHMQPDPEIATLIARASTPGWIFLGPLCLTIFKSAARVDAPWLRRASGALTALSFALLTLSATTPWVIETMRPAPWGYGVGPGPLFGVAALSNILGAGLGVWVGRKGHARRSAAEDRQRVWISAAILIPVMLIGVTDVWFPMRGIVFPSLAPAVFGPLALLLLWLRLRIGRSPLEPAHAANEILEMLPDGVALLDADDHIRIANPSLAQLSGRTPEQLEGLAFGDLVVPTQGEPDRAELRAHPNQPLPVSTSSADLVDPIGGTLGRVVVVRDMREVADLQSRLLLSARLAAVGELAAGIAHEINNPLAFVRSNLSYLEDCWKRMRPQKSEDAEMDEAARDVDELIEESVEGVDRAIEIVRSVRSFAHAGTTTRETTDLRPLLDDVLHVASGQLRNRVNVIREFEDDLPPVPCAPQQMRQVFLNLVINASQAVEDHGTVLVAARVAGDDVVVSVADDGCGIPEHLVERIFDPFFTTKAVGVGTGLGLGIAHQIIASHGGEIEVESSENAGTVFRVRLSASATE
jgi:signal transduction histidine kinase